MRRLLSFLLLWAALPAAAADKAPDWLREMATRETPSYEEPVSAIVLFQEERNTVSTDGSIQTYYRKVVRIVTPTGRSEAIGRVVYATGSSKVRNFSAWAVHSSGEVKAFGSKETTDVALDTDALYTESRAKVIDGSQSVNAGSVFGYEYLRQDRSIFTQFSYDFQDELPALTSRFVLDLPLGWTAESVTFNHGNIPPQVEGSRYSWQLNYLPPVVDEEARPNVTALTPRVAVSFFLPEGSEPLAGPTFREWGEVSSWLAGLSDPRTVATPEIVAKARQLTASADTEFERVSAIGRFAQAVKYISIQMGLGRGGGYEPHDAATVLARSYGDCKDKTTLMRAMLRAVGIESHPVTVFAGDPHYVNERWASPQQFNHVILGVRLTEEVDVSAIVEQEGFGKLLLFDPTDPFTPPGQLRDSLQSSIGLLVHAAGGPVLRLPSTEPEENAVRRVVEAELSPDGTLTARAREDCGGESASWNRRLWKELSPSDYRRMIERWVAHGAPSAVLANLSADDAGDGFALDISFQAQRYAKSIGGQLLIFQPAIVSRRGLSLPADPERRYPLVLNARAYEETVRVKLPAGFTVDEKPLTTELEETFGRYSADWAQEGDELVFTRSLAIRNGQVPAEEYETVRNFFGRIAGAERSPVVLVR